MQKLLARSFLFWFVLLFIAITNAVVREAAYEPLLRPYMGAWAHQVSAVVAITAFFVAIYCFLRWTKSTVPPHKLFWIGLLWVAMTMAFETWMNMSIRQLSWQEVAQTYAIWRGELWPLVLVSLVVSPMWAQHLLNHRPKITTSNHNQAIFDSHH